MAQVRLAMVLPDSNHPVTGAPGRRFHAGRRCLLGAITHPGLLAAVLGLRLLALATNDLWLSPDEAQYWLWSRTPDVGYFSKPPLIAWLIAATTALCGDGPGCVRLSSPLLHALSAVLVGLIGNRLYGSRIGWLSGAGYALLPGVAYSSMLVSTDVPLLVCWSVALLGVVGLASGRSRLDPLLIAVGIGLGLNAKYAMAYLFLGSIVWAFSSRDARAVILSRSYLGAAVVGMVAILPNLAWNAAHGFVTLAHTGGNTGWSAPSVQLSQTVEFLFGQAAIAGPVLLLAGFAAALQAERGNPADRLLLSFSLPVIAVVAVSVTIGDMNANWAAVAYPALVVLGTAFLVRTGRETALIASLATGLAASVLIPAGSILMGRGLVPAPAALQRLQAWEGHAVALDRLATAKAIATIVVTTRSAAAELTYGLRKTSVAVRILHDPAVPPANHFEAGSSWWWTGERPVLIVSGTKPDSPVVPVAIRDLGVLTDGDSQKRPLRLFLVE